MTDIEIEIYEAEHQPTWLLEETEESEPQERSDKE